MLYWIFGIAAVIGVVRLVSARHDGGIAPTISSREADATHVVMNGAMALMAFPGSHFWSGIALWAFAALLLLRFGWTAMAGKRLDGRPAKQGRLTATAYHLLSVLAMIYAMTVMDHAGAMQVHGMHHQSGANWVALVFGAIFLLDGLLTLAAGLFFPRLIMRASEDRAGRTGIIPVDAAPFSRTAFFYAAGAHITMDLGMAWLLLR